MGDAFDEGDADERPVHKVTVDGFYIDPHEVTNRAYRPFDPSHESRLYKTHRLDEDEQPVIEVSWWDAIRYCNWRSHQEGLEVCYNERTGACDFSKNGYRLPTEAEWERAARGGLEGRRYPWGDHMGDRAPCNFSDRRDPSGPGREDVDDGYAVTAPVGRYPSNGYDLQDMGGNVWEWCHDWYDGNYYSKSPASNPRGPTTGRHRVIRGGSWCNDIDFARCANRGRVDPASRIYGHIGFRCVRRS